MSKGRKSDSTGLCELLQPLCLFKALLNIVFRNVWLLFRGMCFPGLFTLETLITGLHEILHRHMFHIMTFHSQRLIFAALM